MMKRLLFPAVVLLNYRSTLLTAEHHPDTVMTIHGPLARVLGAMDEPLHTYMSLTEMT